MQFRITLVFVIFITIFSDLLLAKPQAKRLNIVTTIAPLYLITQEITGNTAQPILLLTNVSSPHHVLLKPSQIQQLHQADLLIWGDPSLENFMPKHLATLPKTTHILTLSKTPDLILWPVHAADHTHHTHIHAHDQAAFDPHFWLSPTNARLIATTIAKYLSKLDPAHARLYQKNLKKFIQRLEKVDQKITAQLKPLRQTPFLVLHNAYQYFEKHYGLTSAGVIAMHPGVPLSVQQLKKIRTLLDTAHPTCVLAEPYYPKAKRNVIPIKQVLSDPLGLDLVQDNAHFTDLLKKIAWSFTQCLNPS